MGCFHSFCQGESHIIDNKVCQDYAITSTRDGVTVAIVCDGHGGNRYFRSDVGAKFAAEITEQSVYSFVRGTKDSLFRGTPFTSIAPRDSVEEDFKTTPVDNAFRQLFSHIISTWNDKIAEHANSHPVSEWEEKYVEKQYLDEFTAQKCLEKTYGCTLMAFVKTARYWFAFHIGDGKCISFQGNPIWDEPIPWDERCFLNKTTSICDSDAIDEFRYCYEGDGRFPTMVCLGSDGIDDSFGDISNMVNFYIQLAKEIIKSEEGAKTSLEETLPELSKIGSKDDMSVACVYEIKSLKKLVPLMIDWQIEQIQNGINDVDAKIESLSKEKTTFLEQSGLDEKERIESQYIQSDLDRAHAQREILIRKMNKVLQEKEGNCFVPYEITPSPKTSIN